MKNIATSTHNAKSKQRPVVIGGFTCFRIFLCVLTGWFSYVVGINLLIASQGNGNWANLISIQEYDSGTQNPKVITAVKSIEHAQTDPPTTQLAGLPAATPH